MTARRPDGLTAVVIVALATLLTVWPAGRLAAQDSQFGIQGLGTPGKQESVRARSAGGAFAPFDAFSPLIDAALADVRRLSAGMTNGTSWRDVPAPDSTETTLRTTRFPALVIAGPILPRLTVGGGFATYLDRTYGITTTDTIVIRGDSEQVRDQITNDGGVTDVRIAAGLRVTRRLALGAGIHLLTGSSRIVATRRFADSATYRTSTSRDEVAYEGMGASFSALLDLGRDLRLAGWYRADTKLRADLNGRTVTENDLPVSYGGGVLWSPGGQAVIAGNAQWHTWSTAGASVNAHDTFNWSLGAEVGSVSAPFRFGVRGGELPFGVNGAPTEVGYSAGLGRQFAAGRGRIDLGVERLERKGTGLTERVWTLLLGVTVRP
jgi:hypothetical protein